MTSDRRDKFARKGHGFPRRDVNITPTERLDTERILGGRDMDVKLRRGKKTILKPARVESTADTQKSDKIRPIPPPSEIPFVKRFAHLDPSRDAEIIYVNECVEVGPATPSYPVGPTFNPTSATVICFDTFPYTRTVLRWVDWTIKDGLECPDMTLSIQVQNENVKYIANPRRAAWPGAGWAPERTVETPTAVDIDQIPNDFHNMLLEVIDKKRVCLIVNNSAPATRFVQVHVWGWIESMTRENEAVFH